MKRTLGIAFLGAALAALVLSLSESGDPVEGGLLPAPSTGEAMPQEPRPTATAPGASAKPMDEGDARSLVGPAGDPARPALEEDPIRAMKHRLYVDKITRESDAAEYEEITRALARLTMERTFETELDDRAALFAGFRSVSDMEQKLDSLEEERPEVSVALRGLVDEAFRISGHVDQLVMEAWDDPRHLDVFDPLTDADRSAWMEGRDTGIKGLYRFTGGTRIGDRQFLLHFDSSFFPNLEYELGILNSKKAEVWALLK